MYKHGDIFVNKSVKNTLGKFAKVKVNSTYSTTFRHMGKTLYINYGNAVNGDTVTSVCAYVVGLTVPVNEFTGEIIAIAKCDDRSRDIWIVAPKGIIYYEPRLNKMLSRFIDSSYSYVCLYEKSCGAVMYTESDNHRKYMLIKNISGHIGFPKGHIEAGENEIATATREIYEETGVRAAITEKFRESYNYTINNFIRKKAVYFLVNFDEKDIRMNIMEISEYLLLEYEDALAALSFQHDKNMLARADEYIDSVINSGCKI